MCREYTPAQNYIHKLVYIPMIDPTIYSASLSGQVIRAVDPPSLPPPVHSCSCWVMECTACLTDKIHPRSLSLLIVFLTGSIKPSRKIILRAPYTSPPVSCQYVHMQLPHTVRATEWLTLTE